MKRLLAEFVTKLGHVELEGFDEHGVAKGQLPFTALVENRFDEP